LRGLGELARQNAPKYLAELVRLALQAEISDVTELGFHGAAVAGGAHEQLLHFPPTPRTVSVATVVSTSIVVASEGRR